MNDGKTYDPGAVRQTLEQERAALKEMSAGSSEERRTVELDQQTVGRLSRMDALQAQAMANALETSRQDRLRHIEAALRRLDAGEYGICAVCGDDIPAKRLAVDPTIVLCINCSH